MGHEILDGYMTAKQVADLFGWKTRQQVSTTARREKWAFQQIGNVKLYAREDVDNYARAKARTRLIAGMGFIHKGLYRSAEYDTICPICREFAVFKPPAGLQEAELLQQNREGKNNSYPWRCVNGHTEASITEAP